METKKYFLILAVISSILMLSPSPSRAPQQPRVSGAFIETIPELPISEERNIFTPEPHQEVSALTLDAQATLVRDKNSGIVLYEKKSSQRLPIASLTKLLTAIVAYQNLDMEQLVEMGKSVKQFRAEDLLRAMLIASSNEAALALAAAASGSEQEFVRMMNQEAKRLGMHNTSFSNPVGFDDPAHYSTASDLALLAEEFMRYPKLMAIAATRSDEIYSADGKVKYQLTTTNKLMLDHEEIVGLKTGYTAEAKGNLIILVDQDEVEYYLIVLGSNQREGDARAILDWIKENFSWSGSETSIGR